MNTPPTAPRPLDPFESALLTELREHVAARSAPAVVAERPRRHRRRWAVGLVAAAATATAVVVASPGGPGTSPAYAVSETADGDVVVTVHRLEDAAGLEAALHEHGIDADVSFDASSPTEIFRLKDPHAGGQSPSDERGTLEREYRPGEEGPRLDHAEPAEPGEAPDVPDCGTDAGEPATLTPEGDSWVLRIPAESPLQDRPVSISTGANGALGVAYAGNDPGSYCSLLSAGA